MTSKAVTPTEIMTLAMTTLRVVFAMVMSWERARGSSPGISTSAASRLTCSPLPTAIPTSAAANAPASLKPSPAISVFPALDFSVTHIALPSGSTPPLHEDAGMPKPLANCSTLDCSSPLSISMEIPLSERDWSSSATPSLASSW